MTTQDKKYIKKLQANLHQIKEFGKAPINLTFYKKHGLITVQKQWGINAVGNKVQKGIKLLLTPKGKQMLSILI